MATDSIKGGEAEVVEQPLKKTLGEGDVANGDAEKACSLPKKGSALCGDTLDSDKAEIQQANVKKGLAPPSEEVAPHVTREEEQEFDAQQEYGSEGDEEEEEEREVDGDPSDGDYDDGEDDVGHDGEDDGGEVGDGGKDENEPPSKRRK